MKTIFSPYSWDYEKSSPSIFTFQLNGFVVYVSSVRFGDLQLLRGYVLTSCGLFFSGSGCIVRIEGQDCKAPKASSLFAVEHHR